MVHVQYSIKQQLYCVLVTLTLTMTQNCVDNRIIHSDHSLTCQRVFIIIERRRFHHLMVRTKINITKIIQYNLYYALDKFIAVGNAYWPHSKVELFTLSSSNWEIKRDYLYYSKIGIAKYSIITVDKKFILFGGWDGLGGKGINKSRFYYRSYLNVVTIPLF